MGGRPDERRAVVLLSGGLDSGVALAECCASDVDALALTCDYGQRAAAREAEAAARLARRFGVAWRQIELPWLGQIAGEAGCALVDSAAPLPAGTAARPGDARSAAAVWVPARNLILCAIAAAYAEARGGGAVVAGFNREEAATFPDNSPAFVGALSAALVWACRTPVRLESPTQALDKAGIVARARAFGLGPADFWSCYTGDETPCGRCESCLRSARAWAS